MNLFYKTQMRRIAFYWWGITDNAIVILDDVFASFGRFNHSEKTAPHLQKKNEYQVINAHKGILA